MKTKKANEKGEIVIVMLSKRFCLAYAIDLEPI